MNLNDLPALVARLEKAQQQARAEFDPMKELLTEIGAALADVIERSEASSAETAKQIAAALRDIRINASITPKVEAPQVSVNVQPTPFNVSVPEPVVQVVQQPRTAWDVEVVDYGPGGAVRKLRVTPVTK